MTALLETRGVWQRFGGLVANSDVSISVGRGVDLIVYGTLIVVIALARPEGLVGLFSRRRKEAAQ